MAYRIVVPGFWDDDKLANAAPATRLLALFLITGRPATVLPGLVNLGIGGLSEAVRMTRKQTAAALADLVKIGFAEVDEVARLIRIPNALKYQASANPNVWRGWFRRLCAFPDSVLTKTHREAFAACLPDTEWGRLLQQEFFGSENIATKPFESTREAFAMDRVRVLSSGSSGGVSCDESWHGELKLTAPPAPVTEDDLLAVYRQYPRKDGKGTGLTKLRSTIRTPSALADLRRAMTAYVAKWRADKLDVQYTPHFSTWVNNWKQWLDPEVARPLAAGSSLPIDDAERSRYLREAEEKPPARWSGLGPLTPRKEGQA